MAIVPEILDHNWPFFPEAKGQAVVKMIEWGYAVGDGFGIGLEDIASNFFNHNRSFSIPKTIAACEGES
jgi:hypothetical protein